MFRDAADRLIAEEAWAEWEAEYQEYLEGLLQDERDEQDRLLASVFMQQKEIDENSTEEPF